MIALKRGTIHVLALLILFSNQACKKDESRAYPGHLRINLINEPPTLDPSLATDSVSFDIITNLMEGLTRFDENLNPVPAVAKSWDIEEEGKRYIFHLREDAKWSDGEKVRADDFAYSWIRLLSPETAAEYAYFLYEIKGAQEFNEGKITDIKDVGIRADGNDLIVNLKRAIVYFPSITTFMVTFPLREDVIKRYGQRWTEPEKIVTNGPFIPAKWHHEYKIVLTPNPYYWRGSPKVSMITAFMVNAQSTGLTLFEMGKIDIVDIPSTDIPRYTNSPYYRHCSFLRGNYYGFNTSKPPFDDPRARKAFSMAIDRRELPRILKGGEIPSTSWIPEGMFGYNPDIGLGFNPEEARRLLAEAGYPEGRGFPEVVAVFNTLPDNQLVAENLQAQWSRNLGVKIKLENEEWKVYLKHLDVDPPQIFRLGWGADFPDPDNFMTLFTSSSGNNHSKWGDENYDRIIAVAAAERNEEERKRLYDLAQKILCEEAVPIIPLYFSALNMLVAERIKGFQPNPMDILYLSGIEAL